MTIPEPAVITLALLLDLTLGDPRWFPHPVVLIGRLIARLEKSLRNSRIPEQFAGVLLMLLTTGSAMVAIWLLLRLSERFHPLAGLLAAALIASTCLAARSLHVESAKVANALVNGDIATARQSLSYIVGRDTDQLNESEIWRALVETVSENTTDGIIAPLFWLTLGGPVGGMAFKAISTLDSMVGYKNARYLRFGWASARMDDLMNFIPARLTSLLMIIGAPLAGLSMGGAVKITLRDRLNHPSPNSGHPEATAAGALGVRLGGAATYGGQASWKEHIGDPLVTSDEKAYRGMLRLMYATTLIMAAACIATTLYLKGAYVRYHL